MIQISDSTHDRDILVAVAAEARALLDPAGDLSVSAIRSRNWVAVPVESASHFNSEDAERLADAAGRVSDVIYATPAQTLTKPQPTYRLGCTRSDFEEFSDTCFLFEYLLLPIDVTNAFAILCSVDDYYVVAGPHDFVEVALGESVDQAIARFNKFVSEPAWDAEKRRSLIKTARYYNMTLHA